MTTTTVLLDLDNTLYPYKPCHEAGQDAALDEARDRGYDFTADTFARFYNEGRREVKRELAGTGAAHDRILYFKRALERHTGTHRPRDAIALTDAYWDAYIDTMDPFPGVMETLEALADRYDIAITTDLTARIQLRKVDHLGITPHIDRVVTSEEVGRDKPASAMFTVPLALFDARPSEAVMVGDSPDADIAGANMVGIETVLFNATYDPERHTTAAEPVHTIEAFPDLLEVLG